MIILAIMVAALSHVGAEPCAYKLGKARPIGPELTGNYAQPYLYSPDTRQWYPDPMFYVAKDALRRWHIRYDYSCHRNGEAYSPKRYKPTIEK
jgi:hypothetical protein